ncbi:hypothetical protein HKCCE3408_17130 [Rhodobacterales bacterium HKCCE3408]|nr:hypothetical protein [Rhodobacterales bacterium HKCCE3408]
MMALAGAAVAVSGAGPAQAQTGPGGLLGGLTASADLGFTLNYNADDGATMTTDLIFGLSSVTRTQSLEITFGGELELGDEVGTDGESYELRPEAGIDYVFNNGATELSFSGAFSTTPVNGAFDDDGIDTTALIEDDGTRQRTDIAVGIAVGLDRAVGANLDYALRQTDYIDTIDPDLNDRQTESVSGGLRLTASRTLTFGIGASWTEVDEDDAVNTVEQTRAVVLSADWQPTPIIGVGAELSFTEVETEIDSMGGRVATVEDGLGGTLAVSFDQRNGFYFVSLGRRITSAGPLDTLEAGRSLTLPGGAAVELSIGVADFDSGETEVIGAARYTRPTRDGEIAFDLVREADVSTSDGEILRTIVTAGYTHEITAISTISFEAGYTSIDEVVTGTETSSQDYGLTYSRLMGGDWALSAGVTYGIDSSTSTADRTDSEAFLTLSRRFSWRP